VVCTKHIGIGRGGLDDLKIHSSSKIHLQAVRSLQNNTGITSLFRDDAISKKALIAELTLIYHKVRHNLSYNSLDCTIKLLKLLFKDSGTAKILHVAEPRQRLWLLVPWHHTAFLQLLNNLPLRLQIEAMQNTFRYCSGIINMVSNSACWTFIKMLMKMPAALLHQFWAN